MEKDLSGELVERRKVRVPGNDILYDPRAVPTEWRSWLARTRKDPPTEEEMARSDCSISWAMIAHLMEAEALRLMFRSMLA